MLPYTSPIPFRRALRAVILPALVSRAGVLAVGLLAATAIGYDPAPNPSALWRVADDPLRNLLARWDTFWYFDIATRGYHWNGNPLEQQNVVFFPLLPMLMHAGGRALGGHPLIAGLVLSLAAFPCALAYLWRWTAERRGERTADTAVALLCAFPFAVFFSTVYTESLFLLAMLGAWHHAERGELARAGAFGFAGGLLRPNGGLLAVPLAWILLAQRGSPLGTVGSAKAFALRTLVISAPLLGTLAYSAYLARHVGDGFAWISGQAAWPTIAPWGAQPPPEPGPPGPLDLWSVAIHVANAFALILALCALGPSTRRLGGACGLLLLANLAPPVARHGLQSLGRFTSVLFPIFVWLAERAGSRRRVWIAAFAAAQIVAAILFFTWRPVV